MNSHEEFIHIHQGCFAGTGAIVRLPQCQWSKPDGYGKISQCITTTKHSKAKTVCIFLGIYCKGSTMAVKISCFRIIKCLNDCWWCMYAGWRTGAWFNKNMSSYQYRKSHCGDKTVVRSSYLYNGISYTGKMTSFYWIRAQLFLLCKLFKRWIFAIGSTYYNIVFWYAHRNDFSQCTSNCIGFGL